MYTHVSLPRPSGPVASVQPLPQRMLALTLNYKTGGYVFLSLGLVLSLAFATAMRHRQFFPTVLALSTNRLFYAASANGAVALLLLVNWVIIKAFFGRLLASERQRVTERFFVFVVEMCFGLTYFRYVLHSTNVAIVVSLLYLKLLHQLCVGRLESIEQQVGIRTVAIIKWVVLTAALAAGDLALTMRFWADASQQEGVGISALFALEAVQMFVLSAHSGGRLLLHAVEAWRGGIWEAKGTLRFYTDIVTEGAACVLNIAFFVHMCHHTMIPFHLIRQLIVNVHGLITTVRDFIAYRTMMRKLHTLDSPTADELEKDDKCSICYDEVTATDGAKKLPCGHIFHKQCLCRWLERNRTCPYCRRPMSQLFLRTEQAQEPNLGAPAPPGPAAGVVPADEAEDANLREAYREYLRAVAGRLDPQPQPQPQPQPAPPSVEKTEPSVAAPATAPLAPITPAPVTREATEAVPVAARASPATEVQAYARFRAAVAAAERQLQLDLAATS